jgi:hypothetical protein
MKTIACLILLCLLSFQVEADDGVSLNDAVNQVKTEGRVLSAKTINGRHEIKILTPNGTVKTINKKAANPNIKIKPPRPEFYNNGGQSMRDRKQNPAIPDRFNRQQKVMKLNQRQLNRSTLDLQPMTKDRKAKSRKPNNKKDKDN